MGFLRFSLAVKYRILFGLAVLAIISAALAVPWFRMEALVLQQPFREAQRIAEDYFRFVLPGQHGALPGAVHGVESGLVTNRPSVSPRYFRLAGPEALETLTSGAEDPFVARAALYLTRRPERPWLWETRREGSERVFRYAQALRATRSCLSCHDEGKSATPFHEQQLLGFIALELPADTAEDELLTNRFALIAAGLLGGMLAVLLFYVITRKFILGPIQQLRSVAIQVAEGETTARAEIQTGDEFEELGDRMNAMLEHLGESQEKLKRANKLLDEKIGEIAEHNVTLYEANRLKSEFLANVTHELRTPLTSIIGFAELLRESSSADTNGKQKRYSENILISGRILLEIINDLLDLAKIEAGKVTLAVTEFNVHEFGDALVEFTKPLAEEKKLWVSYDGDPRVETLTTDRGRLWQILFNLLSNALKFSPEHGRVVLRCERLDDANIRLSVSDNGPGIRPEDQQVIFEKFRQIDQSKTREHQGTGLGLAIARQLTRLLGGEIGVESELGKGATFWVRLPAALPAGMEATMAPMV